MLCWLEGCTMIRVWMSIQVSNLLQPTATNMSHHQFNVRQYIFWRFCSEPTICHSTACYTSAHVEYMAATVLFLCLTLLLKFAPAEVVRSLTENPGITWRQDRVSGVARDFSSSVKSQWSPTYTVCTSVCTLKSPNTGSHTAVWTQKNTVLSGRNE